MIHKVQHLVVWEVVEESEVEVRGKKGPGYTVIDKGTTRS
jgi:hypothetical protein